MRDDAARVADILDACAQIERHISTDRAAFDADPVRQAAAQRWLEIVGEAATRLSEEFRSARPDVPWREIIGMRTILVPTLRALLEP